MSTRFELPLTAGKTGQFLKVNPTETGYVWDTGTPTFNITSINGDTAGAQTLVTGSSGTDFAIVDSGLGVHVFNIPTASASARGLLSSSDWSTFNNKFNVPSGTINQYVRGDGSLSTLPLGGITSLNNLTDAVQTFTTGTSGSDFAISSSGAIHTFNLPTASGSVRGLLSSANWSTFNNKFNVPSGTTSEYVRGDGSIATFPTTPPSGQTSIQFKDEGSNLGTSGTATVVDFVGAGVTATRVSNTVTVTIPGGGGGGGGTKLAIDTTQQTLPSSSTRYYTINIPGGTLGVNDAIRFRLLFSSLTMTSGNLQIGATYGGQAIPNAVLFVNSSTNVTTIDVEGYIIANNSTSAQLSQIIMSGTASQGTGGASSTGLTVDSTVNQDLVFTINSVGNVSGICNGVIVEKITGGGGGGTGTALETTITQTAHGLSVGDVIKVIADNTFGKAQGNSEVNSEAVGIVTTVVSVNSFKYISSAISLSGAFVPVATAGSAVWLSTTVAGGLTATKPSTVGKVARALGTIIQSGSKMYFDIAALAEVIGSGSGGSSGISIGDEIKVPLGAITVPVMIPFGKFVIINKDVYGSDINTGSRKPSSITLSGGSISISEDGQSLYTCQASGGINTSANVTLFKYDINLTLVQTSTWSVGSSTTSRGSAIAGAGGSPFFQDCPFFVKDGHLITLGFGIAFSGVSSDAAAMDFVISGSSLTTPTSTNINIYTNTGNVTKYFGYSRAYSGSIYIQPVGYTPGFQPVNISNNVNTYTYSSLTLSSVVNTSTNPFPIAVAGSSNIGGYTPMGSIIGWFTSSTIKDTTTGSPIYYFSGIYNEYTF